MVTILKNSSGNFVTVDEGETAIITAEFFDSTDTQLDKDSIVTLTATVFNKADNTIINSRDDQNIIDTNGGYVAADGTLTFKLQPADNIIVDTDCSQEDHIVRFEWTWLDIDLDTLTSIVEYQVTVRNLSSPS